MKGRWRVVGREAALTDLSTQELLRALDRHRVLTTDQVARLAETPPRVTRQRLAQLHDVGLVEYLRPGRASGSAARHWWLSRRGARRVAGTAPPAQPSPAFVRHAAAVTEVWLAMREHGPGAGIEPVEWLTGRAGRQDWASGPGGSGPARGLTPDAMLRARLPTGETAAACEVDLATTPPRPQARTARFLEYADDQAWLGAWPHCPPVLMLTTTGSRARAWITAAARTTAAHHRDRGQNHRFAHRGDDGRIVRDADRLVIAACGEAGEPAAAVTGRVWMISDDPGQDLTLAELLGARVAAQAMAADVLDRIEVRTRSPEQSRILHDLVHSPESAELLGPEAAEILAQLGADTAAFVDGFAELADRLLAWWPRRHTGDAGAGAIRADLLTLHRQRWAAQARALLDAARHADGDPRLCPAAARLAAGRLLSPGQPDELAGHALTLQAYWAARLVYPWQSSQDAALSAYRHRRERAARKAWRRLWWWDRRRTRWEDLAAAYDDQHLFVCDTCGVRTPRDAPGPLVGELFSCRYCENGQLVSHTRHHEIPTLAARLETITRRLDDR